MSDEQANAAAEAAGDDAGDDSGSDGGDDSETTTTPEEVAATLKSAGIDVPVPAKAEDGDEGDGSDDDGSDSGDAGDDDDTAEDDAAADASEDGDDSDDAEDDKPVSADASGKEFSFEVKDKTGVTFKINVDDDIDEVLEDFDPKSTGQIIKIISDFKDLKDAKKAYDAEQTVVAEEAAKTERVADIQKGWDGEFKNLNITGEDDKKAVLKFMGEENQKRQDADQPWIASIEHAKLLMDQADVKTAEADKAKADKEEARRKGGLVGGSSAPASTDAPAYKAGGGANTASAALKQMGLI